MSDATPSLTILIITGTVRPGNYTAMASALVADQLRSDGVDVEVIDPAELDLTFPGVPPRGDGQARLQAAVKRAAGVVLATPEYHGSFSSVMKLVIENLGFPSVLSGKPVSLLGVAAGAIGAIKSLEQLRSVCAHIGAHPLPLPVSVANVQRDFARDGRCLDAATEKRIRAAGTNLVNYIRHYVCPAFELERVLREGVA
jgi:FMN reductase